MVRDFGPRGVGQLLDDAIAMYRANWRAILGLAAIVLAPVSVLYGITYAFYLRGVFGLFGELLNSAASGATAPPQPDPVLSFMPVLVNALALLWAIVCAYYTAALYRSAGALLEGRKLVVREMLKVGAEVFLPLVVVQMLVSFLLGILAPLTLLVGAAVAAVLLAMAPAAVVVEGGISSAFSRSYSLVKGHFWHVALLIVGAYLLSTQFEAALASPALIREIVLGAQNQSALTSQLGWGWKVFDGCLQGVAMAVVFPFLQLASFLCYLDLRARGEGMDLIVRARALSDAA
jgi:hypothetical protein